jgi:hypothetical protein
LARWASCDGTPMKSTLLIKECLLAVAVGVVRAYAPRSSHDGLQASEDGRRRRYSYLILSRVEAGPRP